MDVLVDVDEVLVVEVDDDGDVVETTGAPVVTRGASVSSDSPLPPHAERATIEETTIARRGRLILPKAPLIMATVCPLSG